MVNSRVLYGGEMNVSELIEALQKIDDKTVGVAFFCPRCKELSELEGMKQFGFLQTKLPVGVRIKGKVR